MGEQAGLMTRVTNRQQSERLDEATSYNILHAEAWEAPPQAAGALCFVDHLMTKRSQARRQRTLQPTAKGWGIQELKTFRRKCEKEPPLHRAASQKRFSNAMLLNVQRYLFGSVGVPVCFKWFCWHKTPETAVMKSHTSL